MTYSMTLQIMILAYFLGEMQRIAFRLMLSSYVCLCVCVYLCVCYYYYLVIYIAP